MNLNLIINFLSSSSEIFIFLSSSSAKRPSSSSLVRNPDYESTVAHVLALNPKHGRQKKHWTT